MTTGIDAKLYTFENTYDIAVDSNGDIETEDAFDTAIIVSLMTDARADESEVPASENRRGWIGNESTPGIQMGGKLWLFYGARVTSRIQSQLEDAARESLQWFITDDYALAVSAEASISSTTVTLTVAIDRPNAKPDQRYFEIWNATGV